MEKAGTRVASQDAGDFKYGEAGAAISVHLGAAFTALGMRCWPPWSLPTELRFLCPEGKAH